MLKARPKAVLLNYVFVFIKSEIIQDTRSKEFLEEGVVDLQRLTKIPCDKVDGMFYDFNALPTFAT